MTHFTLVQVVGAALIGGSFVALTILGCIEVGTLAGLQGIVLTLLLVVAFFGAGCLLLFGHL